jgi:penicillin G amidase
VAHDPSNELLTFYQLNRASNHSEYMKALDHFDSPAQNFVFASVSGDIAMRVQGKFPVRRKEEGKFVLDGSETSQGWQAFIPDEQNVMYKNPDRGFVSSANQHPVDATYPYYVTATNYEAYRNRRMNKVLSESNRMTVEDMMKLQNDNYNLKAEESLPTFLSLLDSTNFSPQQRKAYHTLRSWNYVNDKNSEGASYYESWWDALTPLIWDEMNQENISLSRPTTYNTIKLIKEKPDFALFDIVSTNDKETAKDVIQKSFVLSVNDIEEWKKTHSQTTVEWGDYKDSYIGHIIPMLKQLSIPVKAGGNHDIVNAHSRTHGPSWRMVVSLEKSGVKTWAVYPGGQSGNPGSAHYSEMIDQWVNGKYYQLLFMHSPDNNGNRIFQSIQLTPSDK